MLEQLGSLHAALAARGRVWGQDNDARLKAMRDEARRIGHECQRIRADELPPQSLFRDLQ